MFLYFIKSLCVFMASLHHRLVSERVFLYREGLLNLVGFSNFSKQVLFYSGLIRKLVRCRDDISLCESGDVDLAALRFGSWSDNQARDTRRREGEEKLRLCVLCRTLENCGVTLGDGVVTIEDAFTR